MIKNKLKRREECNTYLIHICRHCIVYKLQWNNKHRLNLADESHSVGWKLLFCIFSPGSLCSCEVYRHESGSCRTLPSILTFFIDRFENARKPGAFSKHSGFLQLYIITLTEQLKKATVLAESFVFHFQTYWHYTSVSSSFSDRCQSPLSLLIIHLFSYINIKRKPGKVKW